MHKSSVLVTEILDLLDLVIAEDTDQRTSVRQGALAVLAVRQLAHDICQRLLWKFLRFQVGGQDIDLFLCQIYFD